MLCWISFRQVRLFTNIAEVSVGWLVSLYLVWWLCKWHYTYLILCSREWRALFTYVHTVSRIGSVVSGSQIHLTLFFLAIKWHLIIIHRERNSAKILHARKPQILRRTQRKANDLRHDFMPSTHTSRTSRTTRSRETLACRVVVFSSSFHLVCDSTPMRSPCTKGERQSYSITRRRRWRENKTTKIIIILWSFKCGLRTCKRAM